MPYDTVPGPRVQMVRLFLVFIYIRQEDVAKIPKVPEAPCECKSGPGITLLVSVII